MWEVRSIYLFYVYEYGLTKTWRADGPDDGPERKWPVGVDADGPERKWPVGVAAGQLELTGRRGIYLPGIYRVRLHLA